MRCSISCSIFSDCISAGGIAWGAGAPGIVAAVGGTGGVGGTWAAGGATGVDAAGTDSVAAGRITSYNVCYTKLLR